MNYIYLDLKRLLQQHETDLTHEHVFPGSWIWSLKAHFVLDASPGSFIGPFLIALRGDALILCWHFCAQAMSRGFTSRTTKMATLTASTSGEGKI